MRENGNRHRFQVQPLESRLLLSTIYVDANAPGGSHNGAAWSTAYLDLQLALSAAVSGDEIHVADGTYKPTSSTDRTISFQLKNGVSVLGGYAGAGAPNPDARDVALNVSILSGNIGSAGSNADNSYHVVTSTSINAAALLDGFTITAGNANGGVASQAHGGGMYNSVSASPIVSNCIFIGNSTGAKGGAVYNLTSSSPTLTNCTFVRNTANSGGGIYDESSSSPILTNCIFNGNFASADGGGMYNYSSSSPTLVDCAFSGNSASGYGGGIFNGTSSSPLLTNCTLASNSASFYGGGVSDFSASNPTLVNCIVWGNVASTSNQIYQSGGASTITFSDVQDGWAGTGNISSDPLFVSNPAPGADGIWGSPDDDYGNLRLQASSPVADAGNNSALPATIATDLAGSSRFLDIPTTPDSGVGAAPIIDMGAYEAVPAVSANAGGPYVVLQGQSITLNGRGASNVAGALQYSWDLNNDTVFGDATGPNPVFSSVGFPAGFAPVSLRVTDSAAQSITSTVNVIVLSPTVYVDARATGAGNGSSWSNAFTSLTAALNLAIPGVTIKVGTGVYAPMSTLGRMTAFQLKNGVMILGGYAGFGAGTPDARNVGLYQTVLSGDIGNIGNSADNTYHVVSGNTTNATAKMDGFVITGGNANGTTPGPINLGAGMIIVSGSPTVASCTFTGNFANSFGGGIYNSFSAPALTNCTFSGNSVGTSGLGGAIYDSSATPTLSNCTFSGNSVGSSGLGGAIYNTSSSPTLTNCTFSGNFTGTSGDGAGMYNTTSSNPSLINCIFSGNAATDDGGGMYNLSSSPTLTGCTFSGNPANSQGGGIFNTSSSSPLLSACIFSTNSAIAGGGIYSDSSSPWTLTNCVFNGNIVVGGNGGGIYCAASPASLRNCTFVGNSSTGNGGGLYAITAVPLLINCTISSNSASSGGGGIYYASANTGLILTNCIVWGNVAPSGAQVSSPITSITYTDIQGGNGGTGNINVDPALVRNPNPGADGRWATPDDDYGDLRLQPASPCIDVGNNAAVPVGITTDLAGNPRIIDTPGVHDPGAIVDMGAYERQLPLAATGGKFMTDGAQPSLNFTFNTELSSGSLSPGDAVVRQILPNGSLGGSVSVLSFSNNPAALAATFNLPISLPDGNYRATVLSGTVNDVYGSSLASDYSFDFFALAGDATRDRTVDIKDLSILASNLQGIGKVFSQGDFNYDGKVDSVDLGILAAHWQQNLTPPAPSSPATNGLTAPRRTATRMVSVVE